MRKLLVVSMIGLALSSCTKKQPYTSEYKGFKDDGSSEVMSKSLIPENVDFIYNSSGLQMSRKLVGGQPYSFGENKRVQLQVMPDSIRVIEHERDQRYQRDINDKVILEIPIDNVEFECAPDAYGECTSQEREKTNIPWNQKSKFRLKAAAAKMGAAEFLPIIDEQFFSFGDISCFTEVSSQVQSYSLTPEAINIEVKRIFTQNPLCSNDWENLSNTSVSAVFHYSLVRADKALTPDFKKLTYDYKDENTFGLFATIQNDVMDVDNSPSESQQIRLMNHWNPNRTNIDYYLSDEFNNHPHIKELTYEAVRRLNLGLKEAGAKFQITLHEPEHRNPGDIRNSMIILVEDPDESGLLGYGPQTEDPRTGEIISARTVMFLAGFEQETRMVYEEIGRMLARGEAVNASGATGMIKLDSVGSPTSNKKIDRALQAKIGTQIEVKPVVAKGPVKSWKKPLAAAKGNGAGLNSKQLAKMHADLMNYNAHKSGEAFQGDLKSYVSYLREAKNCALTNESGSLSKVRPELSAEIAKTYSDGKGGLRAWTDLNAAERSAVVDKIVSEIWIPVVLHEMGHNMGLRHNFGGSEDKANFYSQEELTQKNVNYQIPYSTIMEYGDDLHALPFLGKYDIAALRYAYARQVEVQNKDATGNVVSSEMRDLNSLACDSKLVSGSIACLEDQLKKDSIAAGVPVDKDGNKAGWALRDYKYCTDESVGPNPGCRRFDEGTTFSEIADYMIQSYKDAYERRNWRNDRTDFSSVDDGAALSGRYQRLQELRAFMEIYEMYKHRFNLSDDSELFETVDWLKDVKTAALKATNFFIEIIAVPDKTCVIAKKDDPNTIVGLMPLAQTLFNSDDMDCRKIADSLNDGFIPVGEVGKFFNDKKSPDSNNKYVDQIDVRGYYIDKIAAARLLFGRNMVGQLSTHNEWMDNAWDIADARGVLKDAITALISNHLVSEQPVNWYDGTTSLLKADYNYHDAMTIAQPLAPFISKQLGLPYSPYYFSNALADTIRDYSYKGNETLVRGHELYSLIGVRVVNHLDQQPPTSAMSVQIDADRKAYILDSNVVAGELLADLQVNRFLGAAAQDGQRPAFQQLAQLLIAKITQQSPQGPAAAPVTLDDLKPITTLTADEAQNVVALAKWLGNSKLLAKMGQLNQGSIMPEEEVLKTLNWLPAF